MRHSSGSMASLAAMAMLGMTYTNPRAFAPRTETDIAAFYPDRPRPKKPNNRPKKLRKNRK